MTSPGGSNEETESYWLKKVKTLNSYNFTNGVTLRFERNSSK